MKKIKERNSSIECLKIIVMLLIIVSHVVQTYGTDHSAIGLSNKYFINIELCSDNIINVLMSIFRYFGAIGNDVFFIASAWFLIDNKKANYSKIINIILDTWIVSMCFLIVFKVLGINITNQDFIKSVLPTITAANWYITCYVLFYVIHQGLNKLINVLTQKQLFRFNLVLIFIYGIICTFETDLLYFNYLIQFIFIYFLIAYVKKYMNNTISNTNINLYIFLISSFLLISLIYITNVLGLTVPLFSDKILHWAKGNNIIIILLSMSLFNLFRGKNFISKKINYVSKLTLLIYVLHENILFRTYIRPYIFVDVYNKFGYNHIVLYILIISIVLFIISCIIGVMYNVTIQRFTKKISNRVFYVLSAICSKIEKKIFLIK